MTDAPVLDSHIHLWDPDQRRYPFLEQEGLGELRKRFDMDDFATAAAATSVGRAIVVQSISSEEETQELLALAASDERVAGVVGWVDLASNAAPGAIEELAARPGLVGFRHHVHDEVVHDWLDQPAVQMAMSAIDKSGRSFDLLISRAQTASALRLIDAFPTTTFVLDHLGLPDTQGSEWDGWALDMREFASRANTVVKLSGAYNRSGRNAPATAVTPYLDFAVETFGPSRSLAGSDWPIVLLSGHDYEDAYRLISDLAKHLSADEASAVFGGAAAAAYGIAVSAPL